jgi:hypothetical protein
MVGTGVGCLIAASISSFILGPMAQEEIAEKREKDENVQSIELVRTYIKYCTAPALLLATGTGLVLYGNNMNVERGAAAMAALTLSETTLREYRNKTKEVIGEKKEQKIRDEIAKDALRQNPVEKKGVILTGNGDYLCFDKMSGRYFRSDIEKLKRIENDLDMRMRHQNYITQNELYYEIGMEPIGTGDRNGWNISDGYIQMEFSYDGSVNGEPCLVMNCRTPLTL